MHHPTDRITHTTAFVTSRGALAGTRNSSMGPPWRIDPTTHRTMSEHSYHRATSCSLQLTKFHFINFFTDLRLQANPCSPLSVTKGDYCCLWDFIWWYAPCSNNTILRSLPRHAHTHNMKKKGLRCTVMFQFFIFFKLNIHWLDNSNQNQLNDVVCYLWIIQSHNTVKLN